MKKNLLFLFLLLCFFSLSGQKKFRSRFHNDNYLRMLIGSDVARFSNALNNSLGGSLWIETPFDEPKFTKIWNPGFFQSRDKFRVHFPGGAGLLVGLVVLTAPLSNSCNGFDDDTYDFLASICAIPEGVSWMPFRSKRVTAGFYCNLLSLDVTSGNIGIDYNPEIGMKANFYPLKNTLICGRIGGRASVANADQGVFASLSFGYDFKRD